MSFQLLGTALFVAGSAIVAFELLHLANRTRQLPEFLLGVGTLGTAVLGYGDLRPLDDGDTRSQFVMRPRDQGARGLRHASVCAVEDDVLLPRVIEAGAI